MLSGGASMLLAGLMILAVVWAIVVLVGGAVIERMGDSHEHTLVKDEPAYEREPRAAA